MTQTNFVMVRSPNLITNNQIGYGWGDIDFSKFDNTSDLINEGFKGIDRGRQTNQMTRYFSLKQGDYVIVPFSGTVAIAEVIGEKSHYPNIKGILYGENRISVRYLKHNDGYFIPRNNLSTALQNRLKIRMTICDLNEFSDELYKHIESIKNDKLYTWNTEQELKLQQNTEKFKVDLLSRLRSNKEMNLQSGGIGLEHLIKEILEAKNYTARIPAKNEKSGVQDVDVIATRFSEFSEKKEGIFIQVKHHNGTTSSHGIKQVAEYEVSEDDYSQIDKVLITTGDFKDNDFADLHNVTVLAGADFINWIYDHLDLLSDDSLLSLGISSLPTLL
jgi:restriction system protein